MKKYLEVRKKLHNKLLEVKARGVPREDWSKVALKELNEERRRGGPPAALHERNQGPVGLEKKRGVIMRCPVWLAIVTFAIGVLVGWVVAHRSGMRYAVETHNNNRGYFISVRRDRLTGDIWERIPFGDWQKVEAPTD
jgi:hypothetical protein